MKKTSLISEVKLKLLALVLAVLAVVVPAADAGIIVSNLTAGTQVIYTGRARVWQIVAYGATANMLAFTDSQYSTNQYYQAAYTRSTNFTISVTNVQTNATFVYDTTTQYLRQTNIITGNARSNITVNAGVVTYPVVTTVPVVAGAISSVPDLDLNFLRGISITATNNATVILYTRD